MPVSLCCSLSSIIPRIGLVCTMEPYQTYVRYGMSTKLVYFAEHKLHVQAQICLSVKFVYLAVCTVWFKLHLTWTDTPLAPPAHTQCHVWGGRYITTNRHPSPLLVSSPHLFVSARALAASALLSPPARSCTDRCRCCVMRAIRAKSGSGSEGSRRGPVKRSSQPRTSGTRGRRLLLGPGAKRCHKQKC